MAISETHFSMNVHVDVIEFVPSFDKSREHFRQGEGGG